MSQDLFGVNYINANQAISDIDAILDELSTVERTLGYASQDFEELRYERVDISAAKSEVALIQERTETLKSNLSALIDSAQEWENSYAAKWQSLSPELGIRRTSTGMSSSWSFQDLVNHFNEQDSIQVVLAELDTQLQTEQIDRATYDFIRSGIMSTGTAFLSRSLTELLQRGTAEVIADSAYRWIQSNTTVFMDRGLVFATGQVVRETPSIFASTIRNGAKFGVPIVGAAIDYTIMRAQGEESTDAAVKATAHMAIGVGAAKVGAIIGSALFPGIGTAFGAACGFVIGVVGNMVFDTIYDNRDTIISTASGFISGIGDTISNAATGIGNAVQGLFSGIARVFGGA